MRWDGITGPGDPINQPNISKYHQMTWGTPGSGDGVSAPARQGLDWIVEPVRPHLRRAVTQ